MLTKAEPKDSSAFFRPPHIQTESAFPKISSSPLERSAACNAAQSGGCLSFTARHLPGGSKGSALMRMIAPELPGPGTGMLTSVSTDLRTFSSMSCGLF
ncbi:MAG: hypothetical protein CMLOHMNK_03676 [Steroidobacteraceae bacterium]|nr:hypothetical protein [Steroidobacteraceae bacterium]